jgi:capsular polysaccharide biosynthesis protein
MRRVEKLEDLTSYKPPTGAAGFEYRQLSDGAMSAPPAPVFLFGPATAVVHEEIFGQFAVPPVGCYRLADGGVAASGVPFQGDTAFTAPSLLHPRHLVITIIGRMAERLMPVRHIEGELAVIYGPAYQTYGHWLADFLPRLWVLSASGHDLSTLSYVVPPDLDEIGLELLFRIGIDSARIICHDYLREHVTADMVVVPTGLRLGNRLSPLFNEATQFWTGLLRERTALPASPAGSRVFLSRGRIRQQRVLVNRDDVEDIAAERGFAVVSPEAMPFQQQVSLFSDARLIVGEYGSALHGSVFSGAGAVVCGLRGNVRHPSFIQSGMGAALRQQTGYVLGDAPRQDVEQRFAVDLADFERALDIMEMAAETPLAAPGAS